MTVVDDIRARLDIVDVVSGYVALQKSGRSFKAPCPFHTERTPSFIVNPERQSWHCFGACSTGGDAFSFVMRHQNLEFGEALRILAQKAGVELSQASKQDSDKRSKLHAVNRLAASWYQERLKSSEGAAAMDYLKRRGVSPEMIDTFQLGYSPNRGNPLKNYLSWMGASEANAIEAGLIYRNDEGRTWDFFRDRLMFPIHDRQGNVIGFGGRQLTDPAPDAPGYNPKYINTAATPIFDKRSSLYGIHRAHSAVRESNTGIIVEGYMDAIAAHQYGYTNVVASMGTALTENQVSQLKSLATNFILALDPDTAGQEATLRSLEASWKVFQRSVNYQTPRGRSQPTLYWSDPVVLKVAALPEGRDPDELIRQDAGKWENLIEEAPLLTRYLIPTITSRFDINTPQGVSQAIDAVFPLIAATHDYYEQQRYLQDLADALNITLEVLKSGLPSGAPQPSRQRNTPHSVGSQSNDRTQITASALNSNREFIRENYLLGLVLNRPTLQTFLDDFSPEYFRNTANREVFTRWMTCGGVDELEASLDEPLKEHLQILLSDNTPDLDSAESERALMECKQFITRQYLTEVPRGATGNVRPRYTAVVGSVGGKSQLWTKV